MKPVISLVCLLFLVVFSTKSNTTFTNDSKQKNYQTDRCTEWDSTPQYEYLYIKICEYESGGSGYYQFKNNYNKNIRFSFKIYHRNGDVTSGSTNVKSGQTHKASCFNCAQKNGGGTTSYAIDKVFFQGEEGYW